MCLSKVQRGMSLFFRREKKLQRIQARSMKQPQKATRRWREHRKTFRNWQVPLGERQATLDSKQNIPPSKLLPVRQVPQVGACNPYVGRYLLQAYPCKHWGKNGVTMRQSTMYLRQACSSQDVPRLHDRGNCLPSLYHQIYYIDDLDGMNETT